MPTDQPAPKPGRRLRRPLAQKVSGEIAGLLPGHRHARHAAAWPRGEWVEQKRRECRYALFFIQKLGAIIRAVTGGTADRFEKRLASRGIAGLGRRGVGVGRLAHQIVQQCFRRFFAFARGKTGEQVRHERARLGLVRRGEPPLQPSSAGALGEQHRRGAWLRVIVVAVGATGVGDERLANGCVVGCERLRLAKRKSQHEHKTGCRAGGHPAASRAASRSFIHAPM